MIIKQKELQTFPYLFPYGLADLRTPRDHKITEKEYFTHLINYYDERFANDSRFRYFAFNFLQRFDSRRNGTLFVKKNKLDNLTVSSLLKKKLKKIKILKKILCHLILK